MESENTWMAKSLIVEMSTPMTMTMNIHLTMTMNILFTIMWMQRATVEVGRHPEESAVPPWLRCSSDAFPPHPAPASLSGTRHCSHSSEAPSQSQSWKQRKVNPVGDFWKQETILQETDGKLRLPVSSARAVHSLLADLDVRPAENRRC